MENNKIKRIKKEFSFLFCFGVPLYSSCHSIRKIIKFQLKEFKYKKIKIEHNSFGHSKGWILLFFDDKNERNKCYNKIKENLFILLKNTNEKIFLNVTICDNIKLCQVFPSASYEQRNEILLDSEGYYSITDEITANSITDSLISILNVLNDKLIYNVVDGTGGCGGNTAGFIRNNQIRFIRSFEQHQERANQLKHNLNILFPNYDPIKWEVISENFLLHLNSLTNCNNNNNDNGDDEYLLFFLINIRQF